MNPKLLYRMVSIKKATCNVDKSSVRGVNMKVGRDLECLGDAVPPLEKPTQESEKSLPVLLL